MIAAAWELYAPFGVAGIVDAPGKPELMPADANPLELDCPNPGGGGGGNMFWLAFIGDGEIVGPVGRVVRPLIPSVVELSKPGGDVFPAKLEFGAAGSEGSGFWEDADRPAANEPARFVEGYE